MVVYGWFICVAAFVFGGATVLSISGKYNLKRQVVSYAVRTENDVQAVLAELDEENALQEGWTKTDGTAYHYDDDILTFLIMGINWENGTGSSAGYMDGGKADTLFLLVLDPHEEMIKVIPINRSTMTEVNIYNEQGIREDTVMEQICNQYGYGDGGKLSCDYQVDAVSNLFCGIPIHGYLAVDMEAVCDVVELIDGVDLEVLENVWNGQQELILKQGEQAHLDGEQAYWYVSDEGDAKELNAGGRLERQKQFLTELIMKVRKKMKRDFTLSVRIYNEISDRTVTDITTDEVAYLAMTAGGYHFDAGQVITVPGRSVSGNNSGDSAYDEFYVDKKALYELVLDVFYEPAEQDGR